MTKRFEKAYNALVNAYFNGTLAKGTCTACAVGNIVADAQGGKIAGSLHVKGMFVCNTNNSFWDNLFSTFSGKQSNNISMYPKEARDLLKLTGYAAEELAKIEYAFETSSKIFLSLEHTEQQILEDQYNGLCAVVDVMIELDQEPIDREAYKAKFRKKLEKAV